ncbi:MAG: endo-1,4-beta-xylanase [Puniceicoccaceae bacterium]
MNKALFLLTLLIPGLISAQEPPVPEGRRYKDIVADKYPNGNVYIGATSSHDQLNQPEGRVLANEFRYCTPANDFKQTTIHPQPGVWSWQKPDDWVQFAEDNNLILRMHGPISPQCSTWTREDARTPEELLQNMTEYMTELCKRYNGHANVRWMDVVNETVNSDGSWKASEPGVAGWETPWTEIGYETDIPSEFTNLDGKVPLYIIKAFQIATEHAPDIKLVLNQHSGMQPAMWAKVKDLILYLRSIGCRVDGVGWQAHIKLTTDDANQWETGAINNQDLSELIRWSHSNDLEFHITENNIHVRPHEEGNTAEHADVFAGIFNALLENRGTGVVTYNLWDILDVPHWSNPNIVKIGLWDRELKPKESYYRLQQILENPPPPVTPLSVDTGDFMGWLVFYDEGFTWNHTLNSWMYMSYDDYAMGSGAWCYFFN